MVLFLSTPIEVIQRLLVMQDEIPANTEFQEVFLDITPSMSLTAFCSCWLRFSRASTFLVSVSLPLSSLFFASTLALLIRTAIPNIKSATNATAATPIASLISIFRRMARSCSLTTSTGRRSM